MSHTIKSTAGGFLIVDDKGNHYGNFGSLSEAYGKIKELEHKPKVEQKAAPKPEPKPEPKPVIHKPKPRGRPALKGKKR